MLSIFRVSPNAFRPTVIDKSWLIKLIGSKLYNCTYTYDFSVCAQSGSCKTPLIEWIISLAPIITSYKIWPMRTNYKGVYIGGKSFCRITRPLK